MKSCRCRLTAPQVREAYLHFMVSIAKITREDKNLTQDDDRVWEEMMQVLELETDIANVSASRSRKWDCETGFGKINNDKMKNEQLLCVCSKRENRTKTVLEHRR